MNKFWIDLLFLLGVQHSCALLDDGGVKAWGDASTGKLGKIPVNADFGDGSGEMGDYLPYVNLGTGAYADQISNGDEFSCVLLLDDTVKCWGSNGDGECGLGHTGTIGNAANEMGDYLQSVEFGDGVIPTFLASGIEASAIITSTDSIKLWGKGGDGKLGYGVDTDVGISANQVFNRENRVDLLEK